ncbi:MAG: toll/interleukin-1 receptor domain-containing protein [Leptolyngbya sp. SIO3F4]|nr:toll/interleukin-1 receptor domain-containing protein [Leptolyngbya sp. SIO3F4]
MERRDKTLKLFYSYSHRDETLRNQLDTHLKILERQNLIQPWHDRCIVAGTDWAKEIDDNLKQADIILLLISADFIASDYCYEIELKQAMERHQADKARVIPIILRPVDWSNTPFSNLQAFPTNAKPITSWSDRDEAWLNVETAIRKAIDDIKAKRYR